jgi:hypothetical protein
MSSPPAPRTTRARTPSEAQRPTKCRRCAIRLDVSCTNPVCDGHGNESWGDVCVYCATNARTNHHFLRKPTSPIASTLYDIGHGEE